jgi:hypothetical protein
MKRMLDFVWTMDVSAFCSLIGRSLASKTIIPCLYFCACLTFGIGHFGHFSRSW